jgi:dissimilatory sulfite reductase (desulfoviridin) alpha/beta subunit
MYSPYNKIADAKMLYLFLNPSKTTIYILLSLLVLTLIFNNFWCRFLCPYGALLGLFSVFSPFKIKRDKTSCISCKKCTNICPMSIEIHNKNKIINPDCMGCYECINNRTNENCLKINHMPLSSNKISIIVTIIFLMIILIAILTGHWVSSVSNKEYANILKYINLLSH